MKLTIFTSNQPRHIALVHELAPLAETVHVVQECNTVFPGEVEDFFRKTPVMQAYFAKVLAAEAKVFGALRFLPENARSISMKHGDLRRLDPKVLEPALNADVIVVFGASFIKPPLCDLLVEKRAYNIHIGTSPYYRGNSCNFWSLYDERPDYVGATIHMLTRGLDSGPMLFHALPAASVIDGFELGMRAVQAAHRGLAHHLRSGSLHNLTPQAQDRTQQIRYTKNVDFNDAVAEEYLARLLSPQEIREKVSARDQSMFLRAFVDS